MPSEHARYSPSASTRLINCPPSLKLCEGIQDKDSPFSLEGTDAHSLCEYELKKALNLSNDEHEPELAWYSEEMQECANGYVSFVVELVEEAKKTCKDTIALVEQKLDISRYIPNTFGTGDFVLCADGVIHIVDYKHGKGVEVSAEKNTQMMIYALGSLEIFDCIYDIKKVVMTIYQPRLNNVSTYEMSKEDLLKWAEEILVPTSKLALAGKGEFKSGSHCRFCKAKTICRERARGNLELAKNEFKEPPLLTDDEIEEILLKIDDLVSWSNDIKDYALQKAIQGKVWCNFKLVEGRSNRKFTDETAVAKTIEEAGFNPYEQKLLSMTELQKRIGKSKFYELVESYIYKPAGKPTLVPRSDKREEINTAIADFTDN